MSTREPCGSQCVRFIGVDKIETRGFQQVANLQSRLRSLHKAIYGVNRSASGQGAFLQSRSGHGGQLRLVTVSLESF